jgi:hypothetical protein
MNFKDLPTPHNLTEAVGILANRMKESEVKALLNIHPDVLHFGIGTAIRNAWGLWGNSVLARWFNSKGIWHADDMSAIILESLKRELGNKPIDLDAQIKYYLEWWKKNKPQGKYGV